MFGIIKKCEIQPTLINLHLNEYKQELQYSPFGVKLDKCIGICYSLNDLSYRVCVPNKTEVLNIHVFNMITGKNESKFQQKNVIKYHGNVNVDLMEKM